MIDYKNKLTKADSSREKCSCCDRTIPKDVERINFPYNTKWGTSWIRVCGECILRLNKVLDLEPIKEWETKLVVEEL